ncbi:hypothetical protein FDH47_gp24 [Arthrobacter phage Brent]|uniref:Uncharacterized protein n=2 Tax=Marthavirus brent TaxID=1980948 RepID=A0A222Z0P6_9CAUD|nr:hypothetical protein FDH47_gp24 [Arthrobacter phage Brent]ALF01235.1 hypothetical protein SEA_BRENT_24 [Arthrobacter phage Brent]ASR78128.1 hypothetical protein SEA_FRANZY_24 [Arthrobacter phage Franzy]
MIAFLGRVFGWNKYVVTDEDKRASTSALAQAEELKAVVHELHKESTIVGARQRVIREENHWTRNLDHVFKGV